MKTINSSPFATKCGNSVGTTRAANTNVRDGSVDPSEGTDPDTHKIYKKHPLYDITYQFQEAILGSATNSFDSYESVTINGSALQQRKYWQLLDTVTASVNAVDLEEKADTGSIPNVTREHNQCSLSNAQWDTVADQTGTLTWLYPNNVDSVPQGIHGKFRFFQPFNIAQSNSDYFNADVLTCQNGVNLGTVCTTAGAADAACVVGSTCAPTGAYEQGPRFWMQMFQRTPQYDLSHYFSSTQTYTHAKFPATGEGRNSAGMDKFAGRGNKSRWTMSDDQLKDNPELQHFFQQQTDMVSQENRDFFDSRAKDSKTSLNNQYMHLKNWDNTVYNNWGAK
jgi:hypothetical protein